MAYDKYAELKKVVEHYNEDDLQKRFSAIVSGETNAGKSYLFRTARMPVHIDSFDPGGSKCLSDLIRSEANPEGQVVVDTTYENEDPFDPKVYNDWKQNHEIRMRTGYFDMFGTYGLDGLSTFSAAVMNNVMKKAGRAGDTPHRNFDYNPTKNEVVNRIRKMMNLTCDFILTAHLKEHEEVISIDSTTGIRNVKVNYRILTIGQAVITIPLLFDELYVIISKGQTRSGPRRVMLLDELGKYQARSRLKRDGVLDAEENPDIKALLKKAGYDHKDKPPLPSGKEV